eukprot:jgi/Botrbrau1/18356/Bobra.0179s0081.1
MGGHWPNPRWARAARLAQAGLRSHVTQNFGNFRFGHAHATSTQLASAFVSHTSHKAHVHTSSCRSLKLEALRSYVHVHVAFMQGASRNLEIQCMLDSSNHSVCLSAWRGTSKPVDKCCCLLHVHVVRTFPKGHMLLEPVRQTDSIDNDILRGDPNAREETKCLWSKICCPDIFLLT